MATPVDILKKYWGYERFRPRQEDIIQSVLNEKDTLAILPTGGGKSVCFQVPGLMLEGVCLVVSPLIALMKDQVGQLKKRNIKAVAITAGMSRGEIDISLDNCIYGEVRFLYVSPERLQSDLFLERAASMKISMLVIDEAHCISQWGHDFRPPYLLIHEFRESLAIKRVVALTATATSKIKKDITEFLKLESPAIFQESLSRSNLSYSVFKTETKEQKLLKIIENVHGSSIVYVHSRRRTAEISALLNSKGISSDFYHAGLGAQARDQKQAQWIANNKRVMVATNAFGMGIDKPDVRTVIHLDIPDSLEAYYQEAGRAGRDEHKAFAVALFTDQDCLIARERIEKSNVDLSLIKRVYQALANHYKLAIGSGTDISFDFDYSTFTRTFSLPVFETHYALKKLEAEGLISFSEEAFLLSRVHFLVRHDELYKFQVAHQQLDTLIKSLLRLYGGEMYTQYVPIKENELTRLMKTTHKDTAQGLDMLQSFGIIDYQRATVRPQISFTTARRDVNSLSIDGKALLDRKRINLEKLDDIIGYLEDENICRTRIIQDYFDELAEEDCRICDNCLSKKNIKLLSLTDILDKITIDGIDIKLLSKSTGISLKPLTQQIREWVDAGILRIEDESRIYVNKS